MAKTADHCVSLDYYLDKYMPVKIQCMISDTLFSCLTGNERRLLELYDADKLSLLYKIILSNDGTEQGNIQN